MGVFVQKVAGKTRSNYDNNIAFPRNRPADICNKYCNYSSESHNPNLTEMSEAAQVKVETSVRSFVEEVDRSGLRR